MKDYDTLALMKSRLRARSVSWIVPSENWTSSWSRSISPRINCPNFFFKKNLQTLFKAQRENTASADFAMFHGNIVTEIGKLKEELGFVMKRRTTVVVVICCDGGDLRRRRTKRGKIHTQKKEREIEFDERMKR